VDKSLTSGTLSRTSIIAIDMDFNRSSFSFTSLPSFP
jgi:hypothetical protein